MTHKRGQWLRSIAAPSILGDGLLERARATSLGLLGLTAAVGLTIVAVAFNQTWPLVAGGPVPPLTPVQEDLGEAKVVTESRSVGRTTAAADRRSAAGRDRAAGAAGAAGAQPDATAPADSSAPPSPSGLVVAPSTPAPSEGGDAPERGGKRGSPPAKPAPAPSPAAPAPASEPVSAPSPSPSPSPPVAEPQPPATVSEAPPASSVPPWSNGNGHAYGRSGEPPGHSHDK